MVRTTLLGVQSGGEGEASVRLTKGGRCELVIRSGGDKNTFPCSLSSLVNVGLGARTHLASDFGACALMRMAGGVKIEVTPWGQAADHYLVPMNDYADALGQLSEAHALREKVSLR